MTAERWQLHWDAPGDGRANMAKDAWLLRRAARDGTASLRLYGWERPTLSVGRAQKVERQVDLAACAALGLPVVRRATGGRAVLHGLDLTYAVAAPLAGGRFAGGILDIYREISRVFLRYFEDLGLGPHAQAYTGRERAQAASPVCFETHSAFEILLRGRKIVGSAQRLLPRAFLQHGSIPLSPQAELLARVFLDADAAAISAGMTDLATELGAEAPPLHELRARLVSAFEETFGIELTPAPWLAEDEAAVQELRAEFPWLVAAPQDAPAPGAGPPSRAG